MSRGTEQKLLIPENLNPFCSSGSSPPGRDTGSSRTPRAKPRTVAVRSGIESENQHGAVVPPIYLSSNFSFAGFEKKRIYDYTRSGNPTRDQLAVALAQLEGGEGGVVTGTGMSAVLLATSLLSPGDLLVAPHDCYGGSYRLFDSLSKKGAFEVVFVDETDPKDCDRALARRPKMVWVETPSNPLLRIVDLADLSKRAHAAGARVVADNTFLSPALQRPLELGADLVVHSTTKYINGHSDVVGGALIAARRDDLEALAFWANCLGITGAPFDSYLTLRGLRTLYPRMALHEQNAAAVVALLERHPAVARLYYPGLSSHPGHAIAREQQAGFGAMVSFELEGTRDQVKRFVEGLSFFSLAESLGGVESLIAHPATMTHASMEPEARRRAGISDQLLRLSIGLEEAEDLVADLSRALDRASTSL